MARQTSSVCFWYSKRGLVIDVVVVELLVALRAAIATSTVTPLLLFLLFLGGGDCRCAYSADVEYVLCGSGREGCGGSPVPGRFVYADLGLNVEGSAECGLWF